MEGEKLLIPYRIYNPEPSEAFLAELDALERLLLACLYTRNHDGFVRQRNLAPLLSSDEPWVIPFIVQLLGEYVIDICEDIAEFTNTTLRTRKTMRRNFVSFFEHNPEFIALTESRATSYWDCYHRTRHTSCATYPGLTTLHALCAVSP